MKILLTVHQFLPDFSTGTEVLTLATARELKKLGHDVSVFTSFPGSNTLKESERFDNYCYEEIPVERFHYAPIAMGSQTNIMEAQYNNRFMANYFKKYLQKLKPDIVHFFHLKRLSASPIDVCEELRIPTVYTPTDFWFVCITHQLQMPEHLLCTGPDARGINCLRHMVAISNPAFIKSLLDLLPDWLVYSMIKLISLTSFSNHSFLSYVRPLINRPAFMKKRMNKLGRVIAPTRLMIKILTEHGLIPEKITYSSFGISLKPFLNCVRPEASECLRIGYVGTLAESKGVHLLLRAFQDLSRDESIELKIYGNTNENTEYVAKLKLLAREDPRITFCGTFPNNQIGNIFSRLDVLVVPSIWYENTPLVIYSAFAAGCPVIASDLGGMSEIVHHEKNGLLFEPGSISGLADAIRRLSRDRELLDRLAKNIEQPKSIECYVAELVSIYKDVIGQMQNSAFVQE